MQTPCGRTGLEKGLVSRLSAHFVNATPFNRGHDRPKRKSILKIGAGLQDPKAFLFLTRTEPRLGTTA